MNVNRIGNKKQGETFKCNSTTEITPNQMKYYIPLWFFDSQIVILVN